MADPVDLQRSRAWRAAQRAARRYLRSGNPLYAWEAAGAALAGGMPIPDAVLPYIARAAQRLGAPPAEHIAKPAPHVFRCLEIAGPGPSAFERRRKFEKDERILREARTAAMRNIEALAGALERVAEDRGRKPETILRNARRRRTSLA